MVLNLFKEMLFGRLARTSIVLFAGGIGAGITGFAFQVVMGHMLPPSEYAVLSAILAFFMIIVSPFYTLLLVIARKVSEFRSSNDDGSITRFFFSVNIRSLVFGVVLSGGALLFIDSLQGLLKVDNRVLIYLFWLVVLLSIFQVLNQAFLQGLQKFNWLSFSGLLVQLLKTLFAILLVWLGYGVGGALWGTVLAVLITWLVTGAALYKSLISGRGRAYQPANLTFKQILPIFIANTAFLILTQIDLVLVNYYFLPDEAGVYASASVLGKVVLFLPAGIAQALFPMVVERHSRGQGSASLMFQAVFLTGVSCGIGILIYYFFGNTIIAVLYGDAYLGAGEILKYYGLAIFPMALVYIAKHFLIAKGRVLFAYLFFPFAPLLLLCIHFFHQTLLQVVLWVGLSGAGLVLLGYGLLWRQYLLGAGKSVPV